MGRLVNIQSCRIAGTWTGRHVDRQTDRLLFGRQACTLSVSDREKRYSGRHKD
jgi:hypothetical protein